MRRPADIFLPRGLGGVKPGAAAVDFAVTSGLRHDKLRIAISEPHRIVGDYAEAKRAFLNTDAKCAEQDIVFVPVVFEAHSGGWGDGARKLVGHFSHLQAARGCYADEGIYRRTAERISVTLAGFNAKAVLRRLAAPASGGAAVPPPLVPEGYDPTA